MASEKKMRKVSKKLHWGRGGGFLKSYGKGIKGLDFFNPSQRQKNKKIDYENI